jgi:MFS transporter, DHA2 family, multidrug resistance protein
VLAGMIRASMAILYIQITNGSLLDIEGGIGTGVDSGARISTSFLIGEIVVIPCAFMHDQGSMIAVRGRKGFAGGILIPMAFTMVLTKLPMPQQSSAASCGKRGTLRGGLQAMPPSNATNRSTFGGLTAS